MPPNHRTIRLAFKRGRASPVGGRRGGGYAAQHGAYFGANQNRFGGERKDAAAPGDLAAVIVLPARARQRKRRFAFAEAERRIGIGIDEDVAVVEGCDELDRRATGSMPLPNTSPDMSPTPTTVNGWRLDVDVRSRGSGA